MALFFPTGNLSPGRQFRFVFILTLPILFPLASCMIIGPSDRLPWKDSTIYYVATNGSDSYNGLHASYQGGSSGPFRTLGLAARKVKAGDSVQIRGGTYQEASSWSTDGTEANPITITNYSSEIVIIDGNSHSIPSGTDSVLFLIRGDWYAISNIEIRYSGGYALTLSGNHCTAANIYAHHNRSWGIISGGSYGLLDSCRAYNNSLMNEDLQSPSAWGGGITVCRYARYTTIRNCMSWENWGEGISTFETYHITIEDCVSFNNHTNFYISDTMYCLLQRNLSYCTSNNPIQKYVNQNCILMGDEKHNPASSDNTVINNIAMGGHRNFAAGAGELTNGLVANNTFVNASNTPGKSVFNVLIYAGTSSNARFENNIILQDDSAAIAINSASGIAFSYNNWSRTPPSNCQGSGDVIGDPQLAKVGLTGPGLLAPGWFRILRSSAARDRAKILNKVNMDIFKTPRGRHPDIGAYEIPN